MTFEIPETLDEEQVFTILAHPTRRKILSTMFLDGSISFSVLANDWKLSTGPIYHHLKQLKPVIEQTKSKHYILNPTGIQLCEWFLQSTQGKTTVRKMNSFTMLSRSIVVRTAYNPKTCLPIALLVLLCGYFSASHMQVLIMGPLSLPLNSHMSVPVLFAINVIAATGAYLLISMFSYISSPKKQALGLKNLTVYVVSIVPSSAIVLILTASNALGIDRLSLATWILLSILCQLWFLIMNSTTLVIFAGSSVERSALIVLTTLYLLVTITFVLQ